MSRIATTFIVMLLISCKTTQHAGSSSASAPTTAAPMTCSFEGQVVSIIPSPSTDSICAKFGCRAWVKIVSVAACGSSVSAPMNAGDTLNIGFAYTLSNNTQALPNAQAHYPGLKPGQHFTATAEQRMRPGSNGEFIVYGYEVVKGK